MTPELTILISLLSSVIAAVTTHYLASRRKKYEVLTEFRIKAYVDFINAATKLVAARRLGRVEDELEDLAILNDAKTRICICADAEIVKELGNFWISGGTFEQEEEILAFTRMCMSIRKSLGNKKYDLMDLGISNILFKIEPSIYSYRLRNNEL
ncbi:hypothetical protein SAMN05421830_1053 [Desulfomicrobium norvegicum]|uniref:Uncharacterized protein n=1 Tax=Desulfomicrobium norvegicum (strain DSM 1741 / NCIMB 8310) TaxID=52561 RepID=A0A8G2C2M7_DESNO|nr:hypothetical protein [Desulfomicrobium norvegicum]SFL69341.1 hypothetical protein SAMN05421830_1053 [Desulfomicrobium norvegicum]